MPITREGSERNLKKRCDGNVRKKIVCGSDSEQIGTVHFASSAAVNKLDNNQECNKTKSSILIQTTTTKKQTLHNMDHFDKETNNKWKDFRIPKINSKVLNSVNMININNLKSKNNLDKSELNKKCFSDMRINNSKIRKLKNRHLINYDPVTNFVKKKLSVKNIGKIKKKKSNVQNVVITSKNSFANINGCKNDMNDKITEADIKTNNNLPVQILNSDTLSNSNCDLSTSNFKPVLTNYSIQSCNLYNIKITRPNGIKSEVPKVLESQTAPLPITQLNPILDCKSFPTTGVNLRKNWKKKFPKENSNSFCKITSKDLVFNNAALEIHDENFKENMKNNQCENHLFPPAESPPIQDLPSNSKDLNSDDDAISLYAFSEVSLEEDLDEITNVEKPKTESNSLTEPMQTKNLMNRLPSVFIGHCYEHFIFKNCNRNRCNRSHDIIPMVKQSILNLELEELIEAFEFTKGNMFFKHTFEFFLEAFSCQKDNINLFMKALEQVMNQDIFERSPLVEKIMNKMEKLGFTFHYALDFIISKFEIDNCNSEVKNICMSDILLNLIVKQGDIKNNWDLVEKLTKFRTEKLDCGVVEDILKYFLNENVNGHLIVSVFECILNRPIVILRKLDSDLIFRFIQKLTDLDFIFEAKLLENFIGINRNDTTEKKLEEGRLGRDCFRNYYCNSSEEREEPVVRDFSTAQSESISEISSVKKTFSLNRTEYLRKIVKDGDVSKFLGMLEEYKSEKSIDSFVFNVIIMWQEENLRFVYRMVERIFNTILINNNNKNRFWFDPHARNVIESLALNVVALFHQDKSWKQAAKIIRKFSNDYSNFVKAKVISRISSPQIKCTRIHKYEYSELGKYLYFCKMFIRAGYLTDAYDILMNRDLKILYEPYNWTIPNNNNFDIAFRQDIVQQFLTKALTYMENNSLNLKLMKNVLVFIIQEKQCIINIDVWKYFNELIIALIDTQENQMIESMLDDIVEGWQLKLQKEALRGLIVVLLRLPNIDPFKLSELYFCACRRGFYKTYNGTENQVDLRTDMLCEEIYLILHMFFVKKVSADLPIENLCINLELPEGVDHRPNLFVNSNVSMSDFRNKICCILATSLYHPVCVRLNNKNPNIIVEKEQLKLLLQFYKHENLTL